MIGASKPMPPRSAIHIITPEFPPALGGVANYVRQVAEGLGAAGEDVHVWCPRGDAGEGFSVHPVMGRFEQRHLRQAGALLDAFPGPRRILVQWVPHGYSRRAMNIPFCVWLWRRALRGDVIELMVHEPYLTFWEGSVRQAAAATVHRVMTMVLLRAAARVWISIPAWEPMWRPYALGRYVPFDWLPIPSSARPPDERDAQIIRNRIAPGGTALVGHVGTYGAPVASMLTKAVRALLWQNSSVRVLLIGVGSEEFLARFAHRDRATAERVTATGELSESVLAAHIAACDVLMQPYPDGISSRRTTAIAGLLLGVPVVSTAGRLTEPLWEESEAVRLVPVDRLGEMALQVNVLLQHPEARMRMVEKGRALYERVFKLQRTIDALTHRRAA